MNDIKVEDLSCACIHSESERYDFSQGYPEDWDYREAVEEEGKVYVFPNEQDEYLGDTGYELWERCEGPMMNYYYPLDIYRLDPEESARKIADLPLCVVHFGTSYDSHPEFALALKAGGMDFSWELCSAHIRLGYLPPLEFCRLPRMAGKDYSSPENRLIIEACKKSCEVASSQIDRVADDLNGLDPE